jgi:hypothetical protein
MKRFMVAMVIVILFGASMALAEEENQLVEVWEFQGPLSISITVNKVPINESDPEYWTFIYFYNDGTFDSEDVWGTYTKVGTKYTFTPDPESSQVYFLYLIAKNGLNPNGNLEFIKPVVKLTGSVKKGVVKGSLKITDSIIPFYDPDSDEKVPKAVGKASLSYKFTGCVGEGCTP